MQRTDLTDADILTFAFARCNAAEIAAYGGMEENVAAARLAHALRNHAKALQEPRPRYFRSGIELAAGPDA